MAAVETVNSQRFAGPNNDIPRPQPAEIPPQLEREMPARIAVLAEGAITPLGNSVDETWENYKAGRTGIEVKEYHPYTDPTYDQQGREQRAQIRAITAGTIKGFDPRKALIETGVLPSKEVRFRLDPFAHYALAASFEALSKVRTHDGTPLLVPRLRSDGTPDSDKQWTINKELIDPVHTTAIIGSGFGGGDVSAEVLEDLKKGNFGSGDHILRALLDRAASSVTQAFGIKGGSEGDVGACASSGKAMLTGMYKIMVGDVELAVVGGTEGILNKPIASAMFDTLDALDRGRDPSTVSRALHKDRNGFTIAEGAVVFVVANPDWARKHGIPILYEIVGYGDTSDAEDNTRPNGIGEEQAMRMARRKAERSGPIEGKVINSGHYTATPLGDGIEVLHTQNVLEDLQDRTKIIATKRLGGHLLGAAGGLSQLIAGKAVQEGVVPGTPMAGEVLDEAYGWDVPQETHADDDVTDAMTNQFGFGGANVTLWSRRTN